MDIPPNMNPKPTLQPHAVLDLDSRAHKALKIERLLGIQPGPNTLKLLEIGTGSGGIAHYFAHHPDIRYQVTAVDVADQRQVVDGYDFRLVDSTHLPFDDTSFDIVISNHVIEHVGNTSAQCHHLTEIRRVMATEGSGYLAVPNRWMLVEPHYQLAFLSWLPESWRSPYLRLMSRGEFYDCSPPSLGELEHMLRTVGLGYQSTTTRALRELIRIEGHSGLLMRAMGMLSDASLDRFGAVMPTLIYRLTKS